LADSYGVFEIFTHLQVKKSEAIFGDADYKELEKAFQYTQTLYKQHFGEEMTAEHLVRANKKKLARQAFFYG
jgi:hypothetical protein